MENFNPTYIVALAAILSVTLISTLALTKDANFSGQVRLNESVSAEFEAERLLPDKTKVDCIPLLEESDSQPCNDR
ncbi:MAG: hypothetical protein AAFR77_07800 [Cyanobacteria bacterium J06631_2]